MSRRFQFSMRRWFRLGHGKAMLNGDQLVRRLLNSKIATPQQIAGCTEAEVRQLEERHGVVLPRSFVDFLLAVGRGAGRLMDDVDFRFDSLDEINASARALLDSWENGRLSLPAAAFVIGMRRGEQFAFLVADGTCDNPPVYLYYEGDGKFRQMADSFWEFIEAELSIFVPKT